MSHNKRPYDEEHEKDDIKRPYDEEHEKDAC